MKKQVSSQEIEKYLNGHDPQKYIIAIEGSYSSQYVSLIINDPEKGKYIQKHKFKTFMWAKPEGILKLYDGKRDKISKLLRENKIKLKKLRIEHDNGEIPERMENGFSYLVEGDCSYGQMINAFKRGGVDIFDPDNRKDFIKLSIQEQFMIQTGKRLFKGIDDYNDLHRLQFDLETTGLNPEPIELTTEDIKKVNKEIRDSDNPYLITERYLFKNGIPVKRKGDRVYSIGIKDNRGFEHTLDVKGDTEEELKNKELLAIETFFAIIDELQPDLIGGFNSENFDFDFLVKRCHQLGGDIKNAAITLNPEKPFRRKSSTVKYGQETEFYEQTLMWGHNIIDTYHSVRRAQAINSNIKKASLKYITQFSKIAKENRVYIPGDMIYKTWSDTENDYGFNDKNGKWYKLSDEKPLKEGYEIVTGEYIAKRYLLDDLWETEQVDFIYNQATFLLSKIVPTTYSKVSTMGTASLWKLLMAGWSYENQLGIPDYGERKSFVGGLSRLVECGFAEFVIKLDYAALYPNTELTHDIFPPFDISGVMKGMLLYIVETRDTFKALKDKHKARVEEIKDGLLKAEANGTLTAEIKAKAEKAIIKHTKLAADADKKQLPIKILANSFFGSFGAPYIFPWGDTNAAEETTCRGRQYLRLLIKFFYENYGFRPLVMDTDGVNFAVPDNVNEFEYVGKGIHRFTEKGKVYKGFDAPVAEFNDLHMEGRMGLDIDEVADSTINFSRKNYADLIDGEVKLVGNSIKSKKMETYVEEFFDVAIRLLLEGKGKEFIEYYQEYVDKIYNYQIPLSKIASKGRVKQTIGEYKKKCKQKNKAGNPMPRQAHMELIMDHGLNPDLGDTIYYVNTGDSKSVGDIKTIKIKKDLPFEVGKAYKVNRKRAKFMVEKINYNPDPKNKKEAKEIVNFDGYFTNKKENKTETIPFNKLKPEQELTGDVDVKLNCMLISKEELENNPDLTTTEYNAARYLDKFNKRIKPLLVVFHPDIRNKILINIKKDKKTKTEMLEEKNIFTRKECELTAGMPYNEEDQDSYEDIMTLSDDEIRFWTSVDKIPNHIDEDKWEETVEDYRIRIREAKHESLNNERELLDEKFKMLEISELDEVSELIETDPDAYQLWLLEKLNVDIDFDEEKEKFYFKSYKWAWDDSKFTQDINNYLCDEAEMFKYREEAEERAEFYDKINLANMLYKSEVAPYQLWLDHKDGQLAKKENLSLEEYREKYDIQKPKIAPPIMTLQNKNE